MNQNHESVHRPERLTYWLIRTNSLGLNRRLLRIRTALELTPRRRRFIAMALGGDFLRPRIS